MRAGAPDVTAEASATFTSDSDSADAASGPVFRWHIKLGLLLLSALLMSVSFAAFNQFYAAWIALIPWLLAINATKSARGAALWGWVGACIFFLANLSYLLLVTIPGAFCLPLYLALYWAVAAAIIRSARLLDLRDHRWSIALRNAAAIACVWVGAEYLRGSAFTGLPWLFLGYSQSQLLAPCQISDITGVYGVSFIVALVNALGAMTLLRSPGRKALLPAWVAAGALVALCALYGWMRMSQQSSLSAGPTVLVVQPNDANFRNKGALEKQNELVRFHFEQTMAALPSARPDLVVWSETTMPALNHEVWETLGNSAVGRFSQQVYQALGGFARSRETSMIVGGYYIDYGTDNGKRVATGMRNSAFYFDRAGNQSGRYDKMHLVPFGEYIPAHYWPWLYRMFLRLSPHSAEYVLTAGASNELTVFSLKARDGGVTRFVCPICFDDIDPALVARMFRGDGGGKRADFIVNLTNDGWFRWNEQSQHLQHALFRSIENRVPTARAVNTGVSGFIDSCGRVGDTIGVRTAGAAAQQLNLDRRLTFYTRFGDVFAYLCLIATMAVILSSLRSRIWPR